METIELRSIRGADRRYSPHLPRYMAISLLLGIFGLGMEYNINGTFLLRPAYRWTTREIPGQALFPADGAYSLGFKGTQLDWRLVRVGPGGEWPDFEVLGYPDIRLTAYRRSDPGPELKGAAGSLEEIEAPNAYSGRMVITPEHHVLGAFPLESGYLILRFENIPSRGGPEVDSNTFINDIGRIAAAVRAGRS